MSATISQDVGGGPGVSRWALWFGLLGGALAWLVHLLFAYVISEFGCGSESNNRSVLGVSTVAWLLLALSVATMTTALGSCVTSWLSMRRLRSVDEGSPPHEMGARLAVAYAGLISSILFSLTILVESIPIFYYLQSC